MTKVYFPREVLPSSAVLVSLVDFAVGAVPLAGLMVYYGVAPGAAILFLPVVLLVHVVFTTAVALALVMANLYFRDVKYLLEIVLLVWMFGSSVVYPVERLGGLTAAMLRVNLMTPIIDAYRAVLLYGQLPDLMPFAAAAAASVAALAVAWSLFHAAEFTFAEKPVSSRRTPDFPSIEVPGRLPALR